MNKRMEDVVVRSGARGESVLSTNSVLRNTYLLLSCTLLFSAFTAWVAVITYAPPLNPLFMIIGMFGLLFFVRATSNSAFGLFAVFAFTGFMGYTLGPVLSLYIHTFSNGSELVMTALGGTGVIFMGLSAYAMSAKQDFNYLSGFLLSGMLVVFFAIILSLFFHSTALEVMISGGIILLMSGYILFDTSRIIKGGERNYINATVDLYLNIYNLFINLLRILAIFAGRRD